MKLLSALLFTVCISLLTVGCATTSTLPSGVVVTNAPVITAESTAKAAIVFKTTVRSLTFITIRKDANAAAYFKAGASALGLVLVQGGDLSPVSISEALANTSIKELKGIEATLTLTTLEGLYEAFYADRVRATIDQQVYLRTFLTAALDGINAGVADAGAK